MSLRALLGERSLQMCLGTSAVTAVPAALAARTMPSPCPPAALPIWLLVGGYAVDAAAAARVLGETLDQLLALGLVERRGDLLHPNAAIACVGAGVTVSDCPERAKRVEGRPPAGDRSPPFDSGLRPSLRAIGNGSAGSHAPIGGVSHAPIGRVPWPDDSSLHLLHSLPAGRIGAWLDVGTGAAVAPLGAGARAARVRGTDVNPHALARAAQGALLSGRTDLELLEADLLDGAAGTAWDLVTFNAPIPAGHAPGAPATAWYTFGPGAALIERFWAGVAAHLRPEAEVLTHTAVGADPWALHAGRPGSLTIARYSPPGEPGFAITRWLPHAPTERRLVEIALLPGHPYVTRAALDPTVT